MLSLFDKLATKVLGYLILSTKCPDQNLKHAGKEGLLARMGKTSLDLDILHELFVHQPNWKKCLYSLLLQFYCASSELSSRNLDFFCDIKTLHWLPLINIRSPILVKIKRFNFQINSICWMPMEGLWDITVRPNSKHEWLKSFFLAHLVEVCLFVSSSLLIDTKQKKRDF